MVEEKIETISMDYADSIIDTVREPLIVLNQDLRVVTANHSFYAAFKVNSEETIGQLIYDLGNKQWDIPKLRELLETILPEKTTFDDYKVEHDFTDIGRRIMLLNARQIERGTGKERIILLAIEDITERKRLEDRVAESEERYRRLFETASDGIVLLEKSKGHIVRANPAAEKMLGYTQDETIGKMLQDIGFPIDFSELEAIMGSLKVFGILHYDDVPVKTRSGKEIFTDIYLVDKAQVAQCNIHDVTAIDPICGMSMNEASAQHVERDGQAFCFCSELSDMTKRFWIGVAISLSSITVIGNALRLRKMRLLKPVTALLIGMALCMPGATLSAATVEYDLTIARQAVSFTGQSAKAMTINGQLPGPTLRFTEGDHAVIRVHNQMDVETSIHWHGILLPNAMDGVPFLTFPPIAPGQTFVYTFDLRQSGTYWYHSHTMLQEQRGLFGAIVIAPKDKGAFDRLRDHVVVLSDWTDEEAESVLHTLKRGSEWYSLQKGSGQSVLGAARLGMLGAYFSRELQRMPPMDLSDVTYERFLLNGAAQQSVAAQPGEKIRLRVIAGSASTFFYLQFAGGPLQIISADGLPVQSFDEQRLLIGVAETYDVIVTVPADGSYEFRATAHDGSGQASLWIGVGPRHAAPDIPYPNLYATMGGLSLKRVLAFTPGGSMGMPGNEVRADTFDQPGMNGMDGMKKMDHGAMPQDSGKTSHVGMASAPAMEHAGHDMDGMAQEAMPMDATTKHHDKPEMVSHEQPAEPGSSWFGLLAEDISSKAPLATDGMSPERPGPPYDKLRALQPTAFDPHKPVREIRLTLDGDMERYVWFINNKPLSETDHIEIKRGEVVRFIMINRTMMHHPMHLHGHFFRVLNAQGEFSPLKHTVDVAPMTTTVIEFAAEEFGDWFFHCHLLYHMESGMARVVHYQDFSPDPATAAVRQRLYHDPFHLYGQMDVLSQMAQGTLVYANTRHIFSAEWQTGWHDLDDVAWEVTPAYDYYLNRFASVFAGIDLEGDGGHIEKQEGILGLRYLLPLNIASRVWMDTAGDFQFAVGKHLELTPRLAIFSEAEYDTKELWEIRAGARYMMTRHFSLIAQWHSRFGWGGGLSWQF